MYLKWIYMFITATRDIKTKQNKCTTDEFNHYNDDDILNNVYKRNLNQKTHPFEGVDGRNPVVFYENLKTVEEICTLNYKYQMKTYLESNISIFLKLDFLDLHTENKPFNMHAGGLFDDWERASF